MESLKRIAQVLWAPTETFRKIAERPTWAVALVALLALGGIVGYLAVQRIDPGDQRAQMRETLEERGLRGAELEQALEQGMRVTEAIAPWTPVFPVVFGAFAYLFVALLFWVAFRLAGGELGYPHSFSVTLHGFAPQALGALIAIPVILGQETLDPEAVQRGSFLASNLGFLAPEDASAVVATLLSSLDLFALWSVVLLTIGYSVVGRVSKGVAGGVVVGAWLLWVAIKVGLAVLFG